MSDNLNLLKDKLNQIKSQTDSIMLSKINTIEKDILRKACSHILVSGKRMRPAITLWVIGAISGNQNKGMSFAASIEMFNTFTLLHDDIIDKDVWRRGVKSVNAEYGEEVALLAGDMLQSLACKNICEDTELDYHVRVKLVDLITDTIRKLCEGEYYDLALEREEFESTEENYLEMASLKTGSLCQAAAQGGSIIADASEDYVKRFAEYGRMFGIGFQIRDDILNLTANEKTLGKPMGSDIRERKITIPLIHFLRKSDPSQKQEFYQLLGKPSTKESIGRVVNLYQSTGSLEYANDRANEFINRAKDSINSLELNQEYKLLLNLISDYAIIREI